MTPFVRSRFDRIADDNYVTVDPRCITVLIDAWDVPAMSVDPCCRSGESGLHPVVAGTFASLERDDVRGAVTNPPYRRPDVDSIHKELINMVCNDTLDMCATLVRVQWDCARSRSEYWKWPFAASVKLQFRPWWSSERAHQPIHNYQWLVWDRRHVGNPVLLHGGHNA